MEPRRPTPQRPRSPKTFGVINEGAGKHLATGESETISVDLKPGSYEIVCFIPGHYAAGQKLPFKVTN